ncbi:MAG: TCR/Tet family MFS transporter [Sphingobacteriia bacterium]|nr:TCR/Tet family MFS transporter [Sphingobacteriia bacterium]
MAKDNKQAALGFIFITLLIDITGFGIIIPVVPKLIMQLGNCNISQASRYGGFLLFAYAFMQFLFAPVVGNLSDKYGRRPVLLFSLLGFAFDYLLTGFAPSLAWLFLGRVVAGITGASFTTASAYIADVSTPEKKAQNFGMVGVAFGIGFIIGPAVGGLLGKFGLRVPFFAAAGLAAINWLYGYFVLPESLSKENRRPFDWKKANPVGTLLMFKKFPVILGLVASIALLYVASHAVQSSWSYYTIEKFGWDSTMIGISLAIVGVAVAIVQGGLIRIIIPKLGQEKSVYIGLALYTLGFLLFGLATQTWMMFTFTFVYCLGGIAGPAIQGLISNYVPRNEQGELQGGLTSLMSLSSIIGPLLMTNVFSYFTSKKSPVYLPGASMYLAAILTLLSTFLAYRTLHLNKPQAAKVSE